MNKIIYKLAFFCTLISTSFSAFAADPVVNTTIKIEKTGSEPFDATSWDPSDVTTAGTDTDVDNDIVRMQDSITYRVEVSVNDAAVDDLVSTVSLPDGKQKWIEIPTGCLTDPAEASPVSEISADGYTLTCNVGPAIEGTTRVFFPAAKVVSYNAITDKAVVNAEETIARTSATATGANTATAGDTVAVITANFQVDTTKELKVTSLDDDGNPLYKAPAKDGPGGASDVGTLMEYVIKVRYQNGSMLIDSNETDFLIDIGLIDAFTDDHDSNNDNGFSSGGLLYTWGPQGADGACSLIGEHGTPSQSIAPAVTCTQNDLPFDFLGSNSDPITGDFTGTADTLNDRNINIDLTNIDVRDPDADGNVVEVAINVWFRRSTEIWGHQSCETNNTNCVSNVINSVGVLAPTGDAIIGYNPVSTEDAGGQQLLNYNGLGEPFANEIDYPMEYTRPGSLSVHKTFTWQQIADKRSFQKNVAPGETVPLFVNHFDYRKLDDGLIQSCEKIDTKIFEYQGLMAPGTLLGSEYYSHNRLVATNPGLLIWGGAEGSKYIGLDGTPLMTLYYTDSATGDGSLEALRSAVCEDDVNEDGKKVIDGVNIDTGLADSPNDWVTDATMLTGGMSSVTRIRQDSVIDTDYIESLYPTYNNLSIPVTHLVKVKPDAAANSYGSEDYLANYMSYRHRNASGTISSWLGTSEANAPTDPSAVGFSQTLQYSDRLKLIASSISIAKRTEPKGIKVVKAGDVVEFIIEPSINGAWDPTITTATVRDTLPPQTIYVAGSEMFSYDGGTTWYSQADFNSNNGKIIISSPANAVDSRLDWEFTDLTPDATSGSDQLPLIKYSVLVDATVTSGDFRNTATLTSAIDNNGGNSPKSAIYTISVFPDYGLDLVKRNVQDIYQTNEAFEFELIYKNLGGESYGESDFIDILPHTDENSAVSSGLLSTRTPPSVFDGTYELSALTGSNGEIFMATSADPVSIPQDPCHEDNQPLNYVPEDGDLCYGYYISENTDGVPAKSANTFAGGGTTGTGTITWETCTAGTVSCGGIPAEEITGIRFKVPSLASGAGGQVVTVELTPTGNKGGTPDIDSDGNVTAASTGNVYTNNFSGRVPEISLLVISNDASVTVVSGSIGSVLWIDQDGSQTQEGIEDIIPNVTVNLLDGNGDPILIDPVTGLVVPAGTPDAIPYSVVTGTDGSYSFDNLPAGDYQVQVDTSDPDFPPNASQTYDTNGTGTDSISDVTLGAEVDPITGELTNVSSDMDQSFGYRQLSALGDYVWDDVNHDGIQDSGETGIVDVTVTLLDASGDPVLSDPADPNSAPITTMTASDGSYSFTDLEPGTYSVSFSTFPTGFIPTLANVGDDTTDSDASAADQATQPVTLAVGETNNTLDLGLYLPATLSGRLWNDENNDGIQDSGEADVEGVTVTLLDGSGNPILDASNNPITTTTDEFGNYEFTGLVAGDYSVAFSNLPAGFETTKSGVGSDDAVDSNVGTDGKTTSVTLAAGETNDTLDAGIFLPATLGNYVWNDLNNDGIQDPTEEGIENVTVTLLDGSGDPILDENNDLITTTTDENGAYSFTGLAPGDYAVQFSDYPTDFEQTTVNAGADIGLDSDAGTDGKTAAVTLEPGDNNDTLDAGLYLPASLGNRVWNDLDRDGVQDAGEAGVANVLVTLLDGAGDPILDDANNPITTTTALDGSYLFTGLAPGTYSVGFSNFPVGFGLTLNDIGDDALDSDVGANGKTAPVTLAPGDNNDTLDAGIYQPASLGNKVWNDLNNDGIQDAGEPGIAGVTVTLLDGSGNPILDTSGEEITVVTGSDGSYLFGGLIPGSYSVAFSDLPEDYGFTKANIETDDGVDSDAGTDGKTAAVTLTAGENNDTLDAGIFKPASIGDTVFYDKNNDGIIDAGEGLSGVTVELTKPDGTKVTLETDSNGNYLFEDLIGGAYTVEVIELTLPAALQGNNTVEPGSENDSTSTLVLGEGENNLDQDFGYYAPGSIGDTIWHDINDDGIVDPGEALADVTVELTQPDGSKITAVTDADGKYLFSDLPEGDYTVEVVDSTLPDALQGNNIIDPDEDNDAKSTVSLGSGEDNTAQDFAYYIPSSIGDTIWHDKNNNGVVDPEEALEGVTVTLTLPDDSTLTTETDENGNYLFEELPAGDYVVTVDETTLPADLQGNITVDPDGGSDSISAVTLNGEESNLDQDFAYVNLGSIGDTIWQDINYDGIADTDEGLSGITVTLLPPADIDLGNGPGVAIETVTLADGSYVFTELPAGEYEVSVNTDTLPTGLTNTVDPDGDLNSISTIELGEGEDNIDQDFAYADLGVITGNVSIDTDGDNIGDEPMSGVLMRLLDNEGNPVMDSEGNPITALTDELGNYSFANIIPGDYQVAQSQPVGYQSTTGEGQPDDLISAINVNGGETAVSNDFVERVVNPANIPTLSEWAMIFLVMMLGLISQREALARRRRY
ncbi:carboxypeptidase regulatory-like domain-containing protein [Cocleimonas sp. KMM 6892]|uniref:SdrD B-like domain-containing protein n=1 Tax=unclassified Cocleimonas TaxID=2639732 RepID=UPI002DB923C6|nr:MULTISPECIES: SdrD B-like domain-containing protein [unclassified Cocleimonas]MEB8432728.1 carboxypeptidase regulatory-like domain-containing protein [Cocleimonas sp. KMM 6892]MEC4715587.1 carboxypeptidase regulatory-like domain-containing protein [Cocleimonas sp. KMM 6895]MEC4744795.1 carboxypeptidase regulatory-like domain-containing protein [Cocleimonas sp. KMM 6896]